MSVSSLDVSSVTLTNDVTARPSPREIMIPMPFGALAAKVWGPDDGYPVLCMHGWQENANTFDTLAPLLSPKFKLVCVDQAGCGLSSHYPLGSAYTTTDIFLVLHRIVHFLGWEKFSYMGHSMGAGMGQLFAAAFPDKIERLVAIDLIKLIAVPPEQQPKRTATHVSQYLTYEMELSKSQKPKYTKDEALDRLTKAVPSLTKESALIMFERGTERVPGDNGEELYCFRRDIRVSYASAMGMTFDQQKAFLAAIKCPHLLIKAKESPKYEGNRMFEETKKVLESNPDFIFLEVEGNHHVHINNPERVAPYINDFLLGRPIDQSFVSDG